MTIRFYNSLTQKLEAFEPLEPGKARVYVCGITTYDLAHAGHARTYTTFDVLVRHLRARGYEVTHVRNVTDVDDKIVKRAAENGEEPLALSARMSKVADKDLATIGCDKPDPSPRVSTHIPEIVELTQKLVDKGHAYVVDTPKGKDVYFSVRSFPTYARLSRRNIDDLLSGARVDVGDIKKDPLDFALWKGAEMNRIYFDFRWEKQRIDAGQEYLICLLKQESNPQGINLPTANLKAIDFENVECGHDLHRAGCYDGDHDPTYAPGEAHFFSDLHVTQAGTEADGLVLNFYCWIRYKSELSR